MQLNGRRLSSNVEDRRGSTVAKAGGLGLGGVIIVGIITLLMGGNAGDVINNGTAVDNALDMGGIIPYVGSGCTVNGCVNSGNITNTCISLTTERLGGIFGYFGGTTKITDCRTTGNVIGASLDTKIGVIAGAPNNNPTVSGCSVGPCEVGLAGSTVTITAENYVDYLKGSSDTKATNLNATNVSFIAE